MKIVKLENGIRVALVPLEGIKAVTIMANVKIGAKYERTNEAGLSHFLEHMAFKGTKKRLGATEIFKEIDGKGASFGAETGYENTAYEITTSGDNREWAMELLSDIIFNSTYPEEEINKEKGVIAEEIKMYQDNPMMGLGSEAVKWLWGESAIGCWDIAGSLGDVEKFNRKGLMEYRNKYFKGEEVVLTIAGNLGNDTEQRVRDCFEMPITNHFETLPKVEVKWTKENRKIIRKSVEQGHFGVMVPAFGSQDRRRYATRLLNVLLAGNTSSRLFEEIRSKRGWAYYVHPVGEKIREAGFWGVQAGVPLGKVEEALAVVSQEILTVKETVAEEELVRTKDYISGKTKLMMDRSDFWADYVSSRLLLDDEYSDPDKELELMKETSLEEVRSLSEEIFVREKIRELIMIDKKVA